MKLSDVINSIKSVYIDGQFVDVKEIELDADDLATDVEDRSFTSCDSGDVSKEVTLYVGNFDGKLIGFYA